MQYKALIDKDLADWIAQALNCGSYLIQWGLMKQSEIIKVLKSETKAQDLAGINKVLKSKDFKTKFRLTGPGFVHFGFTGLIKALTEEGVKIFNTNRVNLVRYEDIETFAKAIPRDERKGTHTPETKADAKAKAKPSSPKQKIKVPIEEDEEDYENDDDFDPYADEDDDIIEDDSFAMKFESNKNSKNKDEDKEDSLQKKKKRLHQKGTGSLFIPKKK